MFLRSVPMRWVNVRQLKNNPSEALRSAAEGPVLVLKGDRPEALILHLGTSPLLDDEEVRRALALSLFQSGGLSLGRAARVACLDPSSFISYLSSRGVSVVDEESAEEEADLETLDEWLASS